MARPSATDRLGRILSMVPWIASHGRPSIVEVCERFGITSDELLADLDVVFVVGLYPYTPESLIEVDLDEEYVSINYTNFFERPLRLSKDEALAILSAGIAASSQPGHDPDGPLARGLRKVADVLDIDLDDDLGIVVDDRTAAAQQLLDRCVAEREVVHLAYFSHARNEHTERDVEPLRLFSADGIWYLDAHCRLTEEHRVFRLDRIDDIVATGATFGPRDAPNSDSSFSLPAELPTVTIEVTAQDEWLLTQFPTRGDERLPDGRIRVSLAVSARPWLERLLLQLGPSARVVDAPAELLEVGADAAGRVLRRYRATS